MSADPLMSEPVMQADPPPWQGPAGVQAPSPVAPAVADASSSDGLVSAAALSAPAELSAGALLRTAREAAGLHIAALAVSLKVPVKKLEALEADRFNVFPDAVFVRALASSVSRSLKIDPAPVLAKLPQSTQPSLTYEESLSHAPFLGTTAVTNTKSGAIMPLAIKWSVALMLVAGLLIAFWPAMPSAVQLHSGLADLKQQLGKLTGFEWPESVATVQEKTLPIIYAPAPVPVPVALPSSEEPGIALAQSTKLPIPAANSLDKSADLVTFLAHGESWVEVTDRTGAIALRKILVPGESAGVSGLLPLNVVVGRADVTDVQVRGRRLDVQSLTRDNVARFEVK